MAVLSIFTALFFLVLFSITAGQPNSPGTPGQYQNMLDELTRTLPAKFVNSIGMEFSYIPAGSFIMGSPPTELGRDDTERQHEVSIPKGFYIGTTEVTQAQWVKVMGENPSFFLSCGQDCPVENVSWEEVQVFLMKLNQMEGTTRYRLPTEAEWEYAARAGSNGPFYTNGEIKDITSLVNSYLDTVGWYYGNSEAGTHPVAQKKPNAFGLYDMLGNVWEWCSDWFTKYPFTATTGDKVPPVGFSKVRRGCSWREAPIYCRLAYRSSKRPETKSPDQGFRVVIDLGEPTTPIAPKEPLPEEPKQLPPEEPIEQKVDKGTCLATKKVILFDLDSDNIRSDMVPILEEAIRLIKKYENAEIHSTGYTCDLGSDAHNLKLSRRRVEAVSKYLINHGIPPERIFATYFGEQRPRVPNTTEDNRKLNRRVELRIFMCPER